MLGGILGLVLGLAIALLWETLDKRVRSEEEIEDTSAFRSSPDSRSRTAGFAATGASPRSTSRTRHRPKRFGCCERRSSLRISSSALARSWSRAPIQREGKSTTIANLAAAFAQSGRRVILVDLDLRQPSLAAFFRRAGQPGVAEVVRGEAALDDALLSVAMPEAEFTPSVQGAQARTGITHALRRLEVLTAGIRLPSDPSQFMASRDSPISSSSSEIEPISSSIDRRPCSPSGTR